MQDIIKQIVVKFKGDDKELKKTLDDVTKGMAKANTAATGGSTANLTKSLRDLSALSKEYAKVGNSMAQMPKAFQSIIQSVRQLAQVDMKNTESQLERMSTKIENRIQRLNRMQESGASPGRIQAYDQVIGRNISQAGQLAQRLAASRAALGDTTPSGDGGGAGSGGFGGMIGAGGPFARFFGYGALIQAPGMALNFAKQFEHEQLSSDAAGRAFGLQQRIAGYRGGDLAQAALARQGGMQRADEYAESQYSKGMMGDLATFGGSLGSLAGGISTRNPMAIGAGAAGLWSSTGNVFSRLFGNRDAAERTRFFQEGLEREKNSTIDPYLAKRFMEQAPERANFARLMGSPTSALWRNQAAAAYETPEAQGQAMQVALQLRGQMGSNAAKGLSLATGRLGNLGGMDFGAMGQILGGVAIGDKGGDKQAEETTKKMMAEAFAAGIEDSGLLENLLKFGSSIAAASRNPIDANAVIQRMAAGIGTDDVNNARTVQGAKEAEQFRQKTFAGDTNLRQNIRQVGAISLLKQLGVPVTASNLDYIEGMSADEINNDPYLKGISKKGTQTGDIIQKNVAATQEAILMSNTDAKAIAMRLRGKQKISQEDARELGVAMTAGNKGLSIEAREQAGYGFLATQGKTASDLGISQERYDKIKQQLEARAEDRDENDPNRKFQKAQSQGAQTEEAQIQNRISKNLDELLQYTQKANDVWKNAGEVGESAEMVEKKISAFVTQIETLTAKVAILNSRMPGSTFSGAAPRQ